MRRRAFLTLMIAVVAADGLRRRYRPADPAEDAGGRLGRGVAEGPDPMLAAA